MVLLGLLASLKVESPVLGIHSAAVPLFVDKWRHVNTVLKGIPQKIMFWPCIKTKIFLVKLVFKKK